MKKHVYRVVFHNEAEEFVEAYNRRAAYNKARALRTGFVRSVNRLIRRDAN
ncbi:hypothetical protein LCGC14_2782460 [marine sediment metagenome]|uniref:Uncharacterized protein n=1 Tax=marine sediment metagenome TaxID=412755 RepID=A0A0F9B1I2_9ZZZZ